MALVAAISDGQRVECMAQLTLQSFSRARLITTSDTVNIPLYSERLPDAFWVGGTAGDLTCVYGDGSTVVVTVAAACGLVPLSQVVRINASGTTATKILALWQI